MINTDNAPAGYNPENHEAPMIHLLLASDNLVMRAKLKKILAQADDIAVTQIAANGKEVLSQLRKSTFDLLLLDMDLPDNDGISLITSVKAYQPALSVMILIGRDQTPMAVHALIAGASGFIARGSDAGILLSAIDQTSIGDIYIDPALTERRIGLPRSNQLHTLLSIHEFTVFLRLGNGKSIDQIAEELSISTEMVSNYKTAIMKKMHLQNVEDLMCLALEDGFAD